MNFEGEVWALLLSENYGDYSNMQPKLRIIALCQKNHTQKKTNNTSQHVLS